MTRKSSKTLTNHCLYTTSIHLFIFYILQKKCKKCLTFSISSDIISKSLYTTNCLWNFLKCTEYITSKSVWFDSSFDSQNRNDFFLLWCWSKCICVDQTGDQDGKCRVCFNWWFWGYYYFLSLILFYPVLGITDLSYKVSVLHKISYTTFMKL